ncbi:MAG: PD40 domain-containing protein [Elusimicrobia bacterium]|nr:PD40 domain-containing protein [Elusimicrobiota bacterium]
MKMTACHSPFRHFAFPALLSVLLYPSFAFAETDIYIGISGSRQFKKTSIALAKFLPSEVSSPDDMDLAEQMREISRADLLFSRYFDIREEPVNPANLSVEEASLDFWKKTGADYLITAKASSRKTVWTFSAKIYDLAAKKTVMEKFYQGKKSGERRAAHLFSDDVIMRLTGRLGIAHSKIAFSNNSTGNKEIYMIDYDGENLVKLTSHRSISLLPRWSQDGIRIYYTTYKYSNPDMFEIDLKTGKIKPFTTYQGLNIPGGFSPDGMAMVMTLSRGDDPNIYLLDITTKEIKKLLTKFGVSSSPTYSPDGKQIAFVSDRSGNPQIYLLELETKKYRKLTRLNWCDSPSWSPSGEWITFAGRETPRENMNIFLVDPSGSQIRRLTYQAGSNEDPSWSPDGRFIAFTSTRRGKRELFVMDLDGSSPHPLTELKGNSYTPNWSP